MPSIDSSEQNESESKLNANFTYSPSVQDVYKYLPHDEKITSYDIIHRILELHFDYGEHLAAKILSSDPPKLNLRKYLDEWFLELKHLFDPSLVDQLHGRLVILGLTVLDEELRKYLENLGFISALKNELSEDFEDLLANSSKQEILEKGDRSVSPDRYIKDNPSIFRSDGAVEQDVLNREPLAKALAIWLTRIWNGLNSEDKSNDSFIIHLHGAWGSGKTTFLNLLDKNLSNKEGYTQEDKSKFTEYKYEWITVWFNAWQHQHIEPAWWPLMDKIYKRSVNGIWEKWKLLKGLKIFLLEQVWRLSTGNQSYFIFFLFSLLIMVLFIFSIEDLNMINISQFSDFEKLVKPIIAVIGITGTIWSGTVLVIRSIFWGSVDAANNYLKFTRDPMAKIRQHFNIQMTRTNYPIIVFIDDLDRCRENYVVGLMEGIQTMLKNRNIIFVIAADRRWLYKCFEQVYKNFLDHVNEPGKRMGSLFLEKAFQLSIPMPRMTNPVKEKFFLHLYGHEDIDTNLKDEEEEAKKALKDKNKDEEIVQTLSNKFPSESSNLKKQIWQNQAVIKSASREVEVETELYLRNFSHLLEPNPRAMVRFINAYSILRAWAIYSDFTILTDEIKRAQFALWTILLLRWPSLVEYLQKKPDQINDLKQQKVGNDTPDLFQKISDNDELLSVINGKGVQIIDNQQKVNIELTANAIYEIVGTISDEAKPN